MTGPRNGELLDDRYRVERPIARGGMSTVYRCVDTRLGRNVAAKVLAPELSADPVARSHFKREARAMAQLSHPCLVNVYDTGSDGAYDFLIMELITGGTLRELTAERGPMPPHAATAVMVPVLTALAVAHRAGMVHRDVKPDNILINGDHQVKLSDFGLVRAASTSVTGSHKIAGTVAYLSPEQVTGEPIGPASDVYSAGIVLFELLTGRTPFAGDDVYEHARARVTGIVPPPSSLIDGVPTLFDHLIATATARDPRERFTDAQEFLDALEDVARELRLPDYVVPVPENTAARRAGENLTLPTDVLTRVNDREDRSTTVLPPSSQQSSPQETAILPTTRPAAPPAAGVSGVAGGAATAVGAGTAALGSAAVAGATAAGRATAAGDIASHAGSESLASYVHAADSTRRYDLEPDRRERERDEQQAIEIDAYGRSQSPETQSYGQQRAPETQVYDSTRFYDQDRGYPEADADYAYGRPDEYQGQRVPAEYDAPRTPDELTEKPVKQVTNRSTGKFITWFVVVILLAAAVGVGGWWFGSGRYGELPDITGLSQQEAFVRIDNAGFEPAVVEVYNNDIPKGDAVGTDPATGQRAVRGRSVALLVSLGRPTVPAIPASGSLADFEAALKERTFTPVTGDPVYSDTVPKGSVAASSPAPGQVAPVGTVVTVSLSQGKKPVSIPELVGKKLDDAIKALEKAGLKACETTKEFSSTVPGGSVISSSPGENETVESGDSVNLLVSNALTVPDVKGASVTEALATLREAGFVGHADSNSGTVAAVYPSPGTLVEPSDNKVDLVVSDKVTIPDLTGWTREEIDRRLRELGLSATLRGNANGTAYRQQPSAHTTVDKNDTLRVWLK